MIGHQLAQEIIDWQTQDSQLLSIKRKEKEFASGNRATNQRYYLLENNQELYFTYREMEILLFLTKDMTYKVMGAKLDLSDRTIECHVRRMRLKVGCINRFDLVEKIMQLKVAQAFKQNYEEDGGVSEES